MHNTGPNLLLVLSIDFGNVLIQFILSQYLSHLLQFPLMIMTGIFHIPTELSAHYEDIKQPENDPGHFTIAKTITFFLNFFIPPF